MWRRGLSNGTMLFDQFQELQFLPQSQDASRYASYGRWDR
jgi:hypothetical protein